ncbi:maltokinase N-terminal cap-like domain-containing protein [Agromyces bauzanensis]|uniref:Maltokinase n=1 Tax=Agromyces bauzanensis TaxID=1308924 RepID=A0A917PTZ0_9MICO|nr:phosphotransferase [Agromyces bauzanensis]GGJ91876.1 trehalose biosynthesis protein [Agromyces bauzanensis]
MDSAVAAIAAWMPRQRWCGGKTHAPRLRRIGAFELPTADPDARVHVRTLLLMDDASTPPILYQLPVVERPERLPSPAASDHLIARLPGGGFLYDGPYDRAYTDALLALIVGEGQAIAEGADAAGRYSGGAGAPRAPAAPGDTAGPPLSAPATVVGGEQSNTSIVYRPADSAPVICKVYRQLHHGENPDVTLQTALAASGSRHVPASVGHVVGEWDDVGQADGRAHGHLAFAQEFLPGVADAWRVALAAAAADTPFTEEARELGAAVAALHLSLGELFPCEEPSPELIGMTTGAWARRLAIAVAEVPELAPRRTEIEAIYERARAGAWPQLQRIHGDLHLGQVILAPERGWVILDFEGEPMRPMDDRTRPDLPVRDVAGMLRSFDYVAGSTAIAFPERASAAARWADASRRAFLDGYVAASGLDLSAYRDLLAAFELDKAVYEAIYETRNRPTWAAIPLSAISSLLQSEPLPASEPRTVEPA